MKRLPVFFAAMAISLSGCAALGEPAHAAREIIVCAIDTVTADCDFTSIAWAARNAEDGDTLVMRAGVYREAAVLRASNLTLRAEPGAHMTGAAAEGKAALVTKGNDIVIEGLECSGIQVPHGNGACVRAEGVNLTLRGVYFHDSQEGVLGGRGRVLIEDSRFERLGGDRATNVGQAHGIYVGHRAEEFILRRSQILASKEEGHEIKSRAKRTLIEDNIIASLNGVDSRQIDIPNAGEIVIRRNVIQKGPRSSNSQFIGIGLERRPENTYDRDHATGPALIEDNLFISDFLGVTRLLFVLNAAPARFKNNTVVGIKPEDLGESTWFRTRKSGGLPPIPLLPAAPPF